MVAGLTVSSSAISIPSSVAVILDAVGSSTTQVDRISHALAWHNYLACFDTWYAIDDVLGWAHDDWSVNLCSCASSGSANTSCGSTSTSLESISIPNNQL